MAVLQVRARPLGAAARAALALLATALGLAAAAAAATPSLAGVNLATNLSANPSAKPAANTRWQAWAEPGFQHIGTAQGLPNEVAIAVAEDPQGFIWVGTLGGVARWDGYQFRVHRFEPGKPGSLPDNLVQLMHRDSAGRLWVGTSAAGLARYETASDSFTRIGAGPQGLSHVSVRAIADDGAGGLWVGTDGGLDQVDGRSGQVRRVALGAEQPDGLPGDRVVALLRDRKGRLWAGTPAGLFRRDAGQARFQPVLLPMPPGAARDAPPPQPECLLEDSAGRLWVGTVRGGAYRLPADGGPARAVQDSTTNHGRVPHSRLKAGDKALAALRVMTLVEARPGEVWLGTQGQGIVVVDAASGQTRRITHRPLVAASLPDNSVRGLYRDRAGLVWAATQAGLSRLDPNAAAVLTISGERATPDGGRARAEFSALMTDDAGRVWMGTHTDGIQIVDAGTAQVQTLRPDASRPATALTPDVVMALVQAPDRSVFVASYRGLYRASADGRRVARVAWPGRSASAGVGPLLREGTRLWVGGLTDGLWTLDTATGQAHAVLNDPARQLTDRRITALAQTPDGELWIGTRNGLNRYTPGSDLVQKIHAASAQPVVSAGAGAGAGASAGAAASAQQAGALAAGFVTSLLVDRSARLWVGTYGGGVHLLEPGSASIKPTFRRVSASQGLPDDNVNAMAQDDAGRIWLSTDSGLAVIDPATLTARALRRAEGVVFQSYWTGAVAHTEAGELLFGASGGLTVVRPALLLPWAHRPAVVLTEVRVGGKPVHIGEQATPVQMQVQVQTQGKTQEKTQMQVQVPVQVPADANSLTVEFAALDYSAPERNRYAHKLLGFDAEWVATGAQHRLASYANLAPGNYTLALRGSNRDGVFSDSELRLPIRVQAAWHQTLWFRGLAALAALAALYAVVHLRTRALRVRRRELQRLVDERTAELQATSAALREKTQALEEKSRVLERASISDPLTGLHNRRFLTQHIEAALSASLRRAVGTAQHVQAGLADADSVTDGDSASDTDTLFFLIDVDHFKRVNDERGHAAGDAVLVQLALRLQAAMRESDYVVRWGGEEFLAVARDTNRARADELAERLRAGVADTPFVLEDGRPLAVTCSVGHACWPFLPRHPHALDWLGVINLADIGLLTAKRLGRNAWVGLHGTEQARPEGLLARARAAPQQALHGGDISISSSRTPEAVGAALMPL